MNTLQVVATIVSLLVLFAGLVAKWSVDRKDTKDNKEALKTLTATLVTVSKDLSETKFDTKESNRLLTAVHRRMDTVEQEQRHQRDVQIKHDSEISFLKEEFRSLKDTQKLRPTE